MWFSVVVAACVPDLSEGRAVAVVQEATEAPASPQATDGLPLPALQASSLLTVDPARSSLGALGAKITATHPIDFGTFDGRVGLEGDTVTGVSFVALVDSLVSDAPRLTAHLKKEDFLWVERFPHATFVSTEVTAGTAVPAYTHTITGNLTIRGKSKSVTFPANLSVTPTEVTARSEFVIDRNDFEVRYPGKPDDLVQDNVVLQIAFVAPRA